MRKQRIASWLIILVIGFGLISLTRVDVWDGSFPQVEFQVTFLDTNKRPKKGVTLSVTDWQGNRAYGYPVTDFTDDYIPTSNEQGEMLFHHVSKGLEFGGKCCRLFFFYQLGTCSAPEYVLHFHLDNAEIARYRYVHYLGTNPNWNALPIVKRCLDERVRSPNALPSQLKIPDSSLTSALDYSVVQRTIIVR